MLHLVTDPVEAGNADPGDTFKMIVPPTIFELASDLDLWEPPDDGECAGRSVTWLRTD